MRYLRGIITWIDSLESGRQFRSWAAILVKILAVVVFVGINVWGIVTCVDTIVASKDLEITPQALIIIGSILEVGITFIIATILAMLFWNRANKLKPLDKDPNFILISIAVIMVQLFGEVSFLVLIGVGVQTLVASIFGSGAPNFVYMLIDDLDVNFDFTVGIVLFLLAVLCSPALLIVAYFAAEKIDVNANIAESLNNIEAKLVSEEPTSDS